MSCRLGSSGLAANLLKAGHALTVYNCRLPRPSPSSLRRAKQCSDVRYWHLADSLRGLAARLLLVAKQTQVTRPNGVYPSVPSFLENFLDAPRRVPERSQIL